MSRTAALLALVLALALPATGQEAAGTPGPPTEVALDVVVRDAQGSLVLDLDRSEMELLQDGVRQEVTHWRLEEQGGADSGQPRLALVFDRLGRDARKEAYDAAREWLERSPSTGREVAVFRVGAGLEMLQDFTADDDAVNRAIEEARESDTRPDHLERNKARLRALRQELATAAEEGRALLTSPEFSILQAGEALARDHGGLDKVNALLALVSGLQSLPGRKAVILFSEGLAYADPDLGSLPAVVSAANRARVSVYAVEHTDLLEDGQAPESPGPTLARLALDTGGALITNERQIVAGLRRAEEDLRAHYVLSYTPPDESWDGGFRTLETRVSRTELSVQDRRGFLAARTAAPTPLLENEAPGLAALENDQAKGEISLRIRTLSFPDEYGQSVVAMVADLSGGSAALVQAEGDEGTWTQDFTVLALIRDEAQRIVHKSSRRYFLAWGEESLDKVDTGRVLFAREAVLPPGRYTIHIVARDAQGEGTGVKSVPLELPSASDDELRVSSLMVVGHAEPHATGEPSPLLYDGYQLFPNLGDPVSRDSGQRLTFLFTLRPGERALAAATVELMRGSTSVLQSSVALPSPDSGGQMQVVKGLQLDALEPGPYVLRLRVNNAQGFQTRSAPFTLGP